MSAQEGGVCPGGGCLPRRGCLPRGCLAQCMLGYIPPPPEQNDRRLSKHSLSATTDGKKSQRGHGCIIIVPYGNTHFVIRLNFH